MTQLDIIPPEVIVVGSGFAGAILAERLASQQGKKVLVLEQRDHIAGNMYDYQDENGIIVHKYGPHLFRTNEERVKNYLSLFTNWHPYQHRVLAEVDNILVPVPFNLRSLELLMPKKAEFFKNKLIDLFGMEVKVPISVLRKHEDIDIRSLGDFIFNKIYLNYTVKQWGQKPEDLDFDTITARVPVHISYDDRYFQQSFQALPDKGYTAMFAKMLAHENIKLQLQTKAHEFITIDRTEKAIYFQGKRFLGLLIYTGQIDELFDYELGELPYRSLKFVTKSHNEAFFQPVGTVNYPNNHAYTRITDYNHMMASPSATNTCITYEYPQEFNRNIEGKNTPYYPIPKDENFELYKRYYKLAQDFPNLHLIGRLAEYRYYDMNDIIIKALDDYEKIFTERQ